MDRLGLHATPCDPQMKFLAFCQIGSFMPALGRKRLPVGAVAEPCGCSLQVRSASKEVGCGTWLSLRTTLISPAACVYSISYIVAPPSRRLNLCCTSTGGSCSDSLKKTRIRTVKSPQLMPVTSNGSSATSTPRQSAGPDTSSPDVLSTNWQHGCTMNLTLSMVSFEVEDGECCCVLTDGSSTLTTTVHLHGFSQLFPGLKSVRLQIRRRKECSLLAAVSRLRCSSSSR